MGSPGLQYNMGSLALPGETQRLNYPAQVQPCFSYTRLCSWAHLDLSFLTSMNISLKSSSLIDEVTEVGGSDERLRGKGGD